MAGCGPSESLRFQKIWGSFSTAPCIFHHVPQPVSLKKYLHHVSHATCQMTHVTCHPSHITNQMSHKNVMSYNKSHQSFLMYHMSWTVCPVRKCSITHVTCLKPSVKCHVLPWLMTKKKVYAKRPRRIRWSMCVVMFISSSCRCHHRPLAVDVSLEHVRPAPATDSMQPQTSRCCSNECLSTMQHMDAATDPSPPRQLAEIKMRMLEGDLAWESGNAKCAPSQCVLCPCV